MITHIVKSNDWVRSQPYDVAAVAADPTSDPHVLVDIAKNAPYKILCVLVLNPAVTDEIMGILYNGIKLLINEQKSLRKQVLGSPFCSPTFLRKVYPKAATSYELLTVVAKNENTPVDVLTQMLPSNSLSMQTSFPLYHVLACKNKNSPVVEVFLSIKNLRLSSEWNTIWGERFPDLVTFCITEYSVDITDWPEEWIYELIKQDNV